MTFRTLGQSCMSDTRTFRCLTTFCRGLNTVAEGGRGTDAGVDQRGHHDHDRDEGGALAQDLRPHPATQGGVQGKGLPQVTGQAQLSDELPAAGHRPQTAPPSLRRHPALEALCNYVCFAKSIVRTYFSRFVRLRTLPSIWGGSGHFGGRVRHLDAGFGHLDAGSGRFGVGPDALVPCLTLRGQVRALGCQVRMGSGQQWADGPTAQTLCHAEMHKAYLGIRAFEEVISNHLCSFVLKIVFFFFSASVCMHMQYFHLI
ncbi:unnamed protein product [Ixodes pacificus]